MKYDTILIRPSRRDYQHKDRFIFFHQPLNLCYLASNLENQGFSVAIYDLEFELLNSQGIIERISKAAPLVIGFTCLTNTISNANKIALLIKNKFPDILMVAGGWHPSALPKRTLQEFKGFDMAIMGEGEDVFSSLVKHVRLKKNYRHLDGISYRDGDNIIQNDSAGLIEDLDKLPFPARHLLNWNMYDRLQPSRELSLKGRRLTSIITSRGCPGQCTFCAVHVVHKNKTRFRSADSVLAEVEECLSRYNISHIDILDDTFTTDTGRLQLILQGFLRLKLKSWSCQTRVDFVDKAILLKMVEAGCREVFFGIESGSQRVLDLLKKNITLKQIRDAVKWAREANVEFIKLSFIVGGHPDEKIEDVLMTKALLKELNPDRAYVGVLVPYPGTEVYKEMKDSGLIFSEDWDKFSMYGTFPVWRTKHFSPRDLVDIQRNILWGYYLRPSYILQRLVKINTKEKVIWWLSVIMMGARLLISSYRQKTSKKRENKNFE